MTDSADSAQPAFSRRSTARVSTDRPSRYGKQLAAHMGRKITTTWDEASQAGSLTFDREGTATGVVELSCHDDILQLDLAADDAHLERLEQVTGIHLDPSGRGPRDHPGAADSGGSRAHARRARGPPGLVVTKRRSVVP